MSWKKSKELSIFFNQFDNNVTDMNELVDEVVDEILSILQGPTVVPLKIAILVCSDD